VLELELELELVLLLSSPLPAAYAKFGETASIVAPKNTA
jgi:hypothetical protein